MQSDHPNEKKSIVIISSLKGFSTAIFLIDAFKKNGNFVFVISDTSHPVANVKYCGVFDLSDALKLHGVDPDLVLFIEGGSMQLFPIGLERIACLCAWYGIDTHMNYEKHLKISRLFDVSFIAQLEYVDKLRLDGIDQAHWLPLAFDQELTPKYNPQRDIDISHIGSSQIGINPKRHQLINKLKQQISNHYFGSATPLEMGEIYSRSRLVFNYSIRNDINMRFFEAMGSGAVLLSNVIFENGIDQLFVNGVHYLTYQDEESLEVLVNELLRDRKRCEMIGAKARENILGRHTYLHRVRELLRILDRTTVKRKIYLEFIFSALLVQGFVGNAIYELSRYIKRLPLTGSARLMRNLILFAINLSAYGVLFIEKLKYKLSK